MVSDTGTARGRIAWHQWWTIAEPVAVFALIMAYIWKLRYSYHDSWIFILGFILASHAWRKENAEKLGFARRNLQECLRDFSPALLFLALAMLAAGMVLETTRPITFDQGVMALMGYYPWGLFQQYLLNGYFVNRFEAAISPRIAPVAAATLFAGAHLPNWFLMLVAFFSGYCCARIYHRYKNLYFLGIAHATIGFLLYLVVPDWISHHLNVGPGWYR